MAKQVLNGITAANPTPTPESGNRPLVASRMISRNNPKIAPMSAAHLADISRLDSPVVRISATAFQIMAAGMGYSSLTNCEGP